MFWIFLRIRDNMVRLILSFQESFQIFFCKRANLIWSDSALFSFRRIWAKKQSNKVVFWLKDNTVWPILSFTIILMVFMKTFFLISSVSSIKFCSKYNTVWPLQYCVWRGFWVFLMLKLNFNIAYYSATFSCLTSSWHGCLKL